MSSAGTHPSLEYVLVAAVAGAGTFLTTPIARGIAVAWGAIARPRDRDVHAVAIPRLGGLAILTGLSLAVFVARQLPTLSAAFDKGPEFQWIMASAVLICFIGALDDRYELDSITKLAGQVLATGLMVTRGGVQLAFLYLPFGDNGTFILSRDIAIPLTILLIVVTVNAINFIDGLDGLAAGVTAIAAASFFVFSYNLAQNHRIDVAAAPTLLSAVLVGACIGFLPHNFVPARVFMGDSGSMLIGLMLAAAATTATTSTDPQTLDNAGKYLPIALPLLLTAAVLAIPLIDLMLAVVRRMSRRQSPFAPDKRHLHHRLLELGHSHRRAVLLMYFWTFLLAFGSTAYSLLHDTWVLVVLVMAAVAVGTMMLIVPRVQRRRRVAHFPDQAQWRADASRSGAGRGAP